MHLSLWIIFFYIFLYFFILKAMAGKSVTLKAGNATNGIGGDFIIESGKPTGANTSNNVIFKTYADSGAADPLEKMRIKNNGNVGIGTNNPTTRLKVVASLDNGNAIAEFDGASTSNKANFISVKNSDGGATAVFGCCPDALDEGGIGICNSSSNGSGNINFYRQDGGLNNLMTISAAGNVGIGTTTPAQLLDLYGGNIKMSTSQNNWVQIGQTILGEALQDESGNSVAINADGTIIAIGAPYNDIDSDNNAYNAGSVRVYEYDSETETWSQIGQDLEYDSPYVFTGYNDIWLNNDGDRIVIPSYGYNNYTGFVRVYEYNGVDTWTQLGSDSDMSGSAQNVIYGWSVCMNSTGSRVCVGETDYNGAGSNRGRALVYDYNGTDAWNLVGGATDMIGSSDDDLFGENVRMSDNGNIIAISAPQKYSSGTKNGYVETYQYNGTDAWNKIGSTITGDAEGDRLGYRNCLAINGDGTILAVSSIYNSTNTGYVKIYEYVDNDWSQKGSTLSGSYINDNFGRGLTLSNNGLILGIGAWGASSDSSGLVYGEQGEVKVYQYNSTDDTWDQIGDTFFGIQNSRFGETIRMNNAGTKIVCGSETYGYTKTDYLIGATRVFEYKSQSVSLLNSDVYGSIGIGTSDIKGTLHIHKKEGNNVLRISNDDKTKYKNVLLFESDGILRTQDSNHQIVFDATNNQMRFYEYGDYTWNYSNFSSQTFVEKMRLTSNGLLGIGTSSPNELLHIAGNSLIENALILQDRNKIYSIDDKRNNYWSSFSSTTLQGANTGDLYGSFIKLSKDGTVLAIAAPDESTGVLTNNGTVYMYKYLNGAWSLMGSKIEGTDSLSVLSSIDLNANGTIVVIGFRAQGNGRAIVYEYSDGSWSQKGDVKTGDNANDNLGASVKINDEGTIIAISDSEYDFNGKSDRGRTRCFKYNSSGNTWNIMGNTLFGEDANDEAVCVAMNSSGIIVAIGSQNNDDQGTNRGQVEVYRYYENTSRWGQLGSDLYGEANSDGMPTSASFSADGYILALSSNVNAGDGGTARGHVRVYQYSSSSWSQLGSDIDGTSDSDLFGASCQLSSDGYTLVVGANQDINGDGYVKIYNYIDGDWSLIETISTTGSQHQFGYAVSCSCDGNIIAVTSKQYDTSRGKVTTYRRGHTVSNIEIINSSSSISAASNSALQLTSNSVTFTLPTADGSDGQVLSTNGSGTLSWSDGGGGGDVSASGNNIFTGTNEFRNTVTMDQSNIVFTDASDNIACTIEYQAEGLTITEALGGNTSSLILGPENIELKTNGNTTLFCERVGNVGIGTDNPSSRLDVRGPIRVGNNDLAKIISNGNNDLRLQTGNSTTGYINITDGADGNITLLTNGSGKIVADGGIQLEKQMIITQQTDTISGNVEIDFSSGNDFFYTLSNGATVTFTAPTNETVGQQGTITLKTGSTGTNTLNWATSSKWYFEGATAPTITQETSVYDIYSYYVVESGVILVSGINTFKQYV
jgi:hypothetical protein